MAISTGDAIYKYGTQTTVTTAASTLANGSVDSETKTTLTSSAPLANLSLSFQVASATTIVSAINVYRRDLNIDGTNNAPVPTLNNKSIFVGSFLVPSGLTANTTYYLPLPGIPISATSVFYIQNGTGQTINSGWILKATPVTYGPSP